MAQITQMGTEVRAESGVITKQLLETVVKSKEDRDNIEIKNFAIKKGCLWGDCFLGISFMVTVTTEENNSERIYDFFVKCAHKNAFLREITLVHWEIFQRENMAYTEIINDMVLYQSECNISHLGPSTPAMYHSIIDKECSVLFLENMQSKGYVMADKKIGLNYEECRLVMRELAIFHALAFAIKMKTPEKIKQYKYLITDGQDIGFPNTERINSAVHILKTLSSDKEFLQHIDRIPKLDADEIFLHALKPVEPYALICHGDLWCNNLLFKYKDGEATGTPEDVKLIDFQFTRYSLPTTDLSYFFYTSTTQALRKKHLNKLLRLYHSVFMDILKRLELEFPQFTFSVLEELFVSTVKYGLLKSFIMIPGFLLKHVDLTFDGDTMDEIKEFIEKVYRESAEKEFAPIIVDRLSGVVEDAIAMGVI